jgi:hypothetical protein
VPEASVDEDDFALTSKYQVWFAGKVGGVQPKAIAEAVCGAAHQKLGRGVCRSNRLHRSATQGADHRRAFTRWRQSVNSPLTTDSSGGHDSKKTEPGIKPGSAAGTLADQRITSPLRNGQLPTEPIVLSEKYVHWVSTHGPLPAHSTNHGCSPCYPPSEPLLYEGSGDATGAFDMRLLRRQLDSKRVKDREDVIGDEIRAVRLAGE